MAGALSQHTRRLGARFLLTAARGGTFRERTYSLDPFSGANTHAKNLGYLYEIGVNGPANPDEAAKWYLRAAVSGFVRAQFNLGTLYLRGAGVKRNDEVAAHWISEAADAGCPAAIAALGVLYANGVGVPHDEQKALELIQKSANKDDPRLCTRYGNRTNSHDSSR
jgi:hypothetical protein